MTKLTMYKFEASEVVYRVRFKDKHVGNIIKVLVPAHSKCPEAKHMWMAYEIVGTVTDKKQDERVNIPWKDTPEEVLAEWNRLLEEANAKA